MAAGADATEVYGLNCPVYAERLVFAGTNWTIGHASPGSTAGTHWWFTEGTGAGLFETYFLVRNMSAQWTTATLTYRQPSGAVIAHQTVTVAPGSRTTVWANGTTGAQDFSTDVSSPQMITPNGRCTGPRMARHSRRPQGRARSRSWGVTRCRPRQSQRPVRTRSRRACLWRPSLAPPSPRPPSGRPPRPSGGHHGERVGDDTKHQRLELVRVEPRGGKRP